MADDPRRAEQEYLRERMREQDPEWQSGVILGATEAEQPEPSVARSCLALTGWVIALALAVILLIGSLALLLT